MCEKPAGINVILSTIFKHQLWIQYVSGWTCARASANPTLALCNQVTDSLASILLPDEKLRVFELDSVSQTLRLLCAPLHCLFRTTMIITVLLFKETYPLFDALILVLKHVTKMYIAFLISSISREINKNWIELNWIELNWIEPHNNWYFSFPLI